MKITKLSIRNLRGINELKMHLQGKSVVFFGINGSGKTTVLQAVNLVFSNVITKLVQNRFKQQMNIESMDVRSGSSICVINISFTFEGVEYTYGRRVDKSRNKRNHMSYDHLVAFAESYYEHNNSAYIEDSSNNACLPIYANYGVNRSVVDVPLRIRKSHVFDPLYAYENAIQNKVDFRTFFEWFRSREDYENEMRSRTDPNYVDKQLDAVRNAVRIMLGENEYSGLCVKRNPLSMKITKQGRTLDIRQLSDGEKCTIGLIGDMARRAAMANPCADNPLETNGIVLIDEVELHLHPTWQRRIVPTLHHIFPNIQFMITTHSPQVLGDIPDDIMVFEIYSDEGNITASEIKSLRGWDVNSILENNMKTSSQNLEVRGRINRAYELVASKEYSEAEQIVDDLEMMTNSKHADVVKLRFLISRGKR